ncbi:hypothetical protein FAIPA1_270049 [Frankia sp. AiPs1]
MWQHNFMAEYHTARVGIFFWLGHRPESHRMIHGRTTRRQRGAGWVSRRGLSHRCPALWPAA